jgi:phosphatidylglycerophosphatase A
MLNAFRGRADVALAAAAGLAATFSLATVAWGGREERASGRRDPGWVVSDEAAGAFVCCLGLGGALGLFMAFAGFRALDVLKPFPIGRLQRLPGGLGILADDLACAAAVAGGLRFADWLAPAWGLVSP